MTVIKSLERALVKTTCDAPLRENSHGLLGASHPCAIYVKETFEREIKQSVREVITC